MIVHLPELTLEFKKLEEIYLKAKKSETKIDEKLSIGKKITINRNLLGKKFSMNTATKIKPGVKISVTNFSNSDIGKKVVVLDDNGEYILAKNPAISNVRYYIKKDNYLYKSLNENHEVRIKNLLHEVSFEILQGGLADNLKLKDIAKKHNVDIEEIKAEAKMGIKVELEHTDDKNLAFEIAKDHLFEDPKYYSKLKTIETPEKLVESYLK